MSKIIRGVSKNARFFLVDSTNIVQEALDIHKCSPTAIDAFGRLLTAGVMMGSTLKGKDLLTLRTDTDGPLDNMVVTADSDGGVKGYVSNPSADVVLTDNGKSNVGALIGKGMLRIIKDMGLKEPYVGMSPIDSGEIAQDLAYYFFNSDQTPTVIALGVKLKDEKTVACAGGYMIQLLPGAEECFIGALEEKIQAIRPMTELMMGGMDLKRILKLLYEDMSSEDNEKLHRFGIHFPTILFFTLTKNKRLVCKPESLCQHGHDHSYLTGCSINTQLDSRLRLIRINKRKNNFISYLI